MSLSMVVLSRALAKQHLSLSDVKAMAYDPQTMAEALTNGDVDAVVTYFPFAIAMDNQPEVDCIFDTREIPEEVMDIFSVDPAILKDNPHFVEKFHLVWKKALEYTQAHKEEAYSIMALHEKISSKEFEDSLSGIKPIPAEDQAALMKSGGILEKNIESTAQVLAQCGEVDTLKEIDSGSFIAKVEDT